MGIMMESYLHEPKNVSLTKTGLQEALKSSWAPLAEFHLSHLLSLSSTEIPSDPVQDCANLIHIWSCTFRTLEDMEEIYLSSSLANVSTNLRQSLEDANLIAHGVSVDRGRIVKEAVNTLLKYFETNKSTHHLQRRLNDWQSLNVDPEFQDKPLHWRIQFLRPIIQYELAKDESPGSPQKPNAPHNQNSVSKPKTGTIRDDNTEVIPQYQPTTVSEVQLSGGFSCMAQYFISRLSQNPKLTPKMASGSALERIQYLENSGFTYRSLLRFYHKEKDRIQKSEAANQDLLELKRALFKKIYLANRTVVPEEISRTVDLIHGFLRPKFGSHDG